MTSIWSLIQNPVFALAGPEGPVLLFLALRYSFSKEWR